MASRYRISPAVIIVCLFLHSAFAQGAGAPEYPIFRQELAPYVNARTVVEFSRDELLQHYPELEKKLEFAKDQEMLGPLLQRLGERVADFFRTFQDTSSVEDVQQRVSDPQGNSRTFYSKFMYLMLVDSKQRNHIEESRADEEGRPLDLRGYEHGFLRAWNLLGQLTFFLPKRLSESGFRYLGTTSNPKAHVIAFAQKPDRTSIVGTIVTLDGRKMLLYQGLVWIDPENCQVLRMKSDLLVPRSDILLDGQTTNIDFREIRFPDGQALWLPREVKVDAVYMHVRYRNRHRYSDYKRFTVESRDEIKVPKVSPAESKRQ